MKHGHARRGAKTRVYKIWCLLGHRKYTNAPVCDRWRNFENFLEDMGEPPSPRHTIDRIDNNRGYEPGNCRWATWVEQQNNRTNNRRLTLGDRTQTLQQWANEMGLKRETIAKRLDLLDWPIEEALTREASFAPRVKRPPHNTEWFSFGGRKWTLPQLAEEYGIPYQTLRQRIRRYGFTLEEALTTPVKRSPRKG